MTYVAGIDFSSFAVDIVKVPREGGRPEWHRYELEGQDAFDRTRTVADVVPGRISTFWEDVECVGIEHPAGKFGVGDMLRVQGAVLGRIPALTLVQPLPPGRWRALNGLAGNASKDEVARHSIGICFQQGPAGFPYVDWKQDAHDAHLIALATLNLLDRNPLPESEAA